MVHAPAASAKNQRHSGLLSDIVEAIERASEDALPVLDTQINSISPTTEPTVLVTTPTGLVINSFDLNTDFLGGAEFEHKRAVVAPRSASPSIAPTTIQTEASNYVVDFDIKGFTPAVRIADLGGNLDDDDARTTWAPSSTPTMIPTAGPSLNPTLTPTPSPTWLPSTSPTYSVALNGMAMKDDDNGDDDDTIN
jgi:hypothetical protein